MVNVRVNVRSFYAKSVVVFFVNDNTITEQVIYVRNDIGERFTRYPYPNPTASKDLRLTPREILGGLYHD